MREERNSSSYMDHYASSKKGQGRYRHHHFTERQHQRDGGGVNSSQRSSSGVLPPPVSIGFPGSYQQAQQQSQHANNNGYNASSSMHRSFKTRRSGAAGNERGQKGEFVAINMHRSAEREQNTSMSSVSGSIGGSMVQAETVGHHDQRRYSFDTAQYSSGDDAYDNYEAVTVDTKHGDGIHGRHPMMLHGQSSRQNQDNIKYARVIAQSSRSSSAKSRGGNGSKNDGGSGNSSGVSGNGRSPLHRQTLVSSSKFQHHKWPSVGRQQQRQPSSSRRKKHSVSGERTASHGGGSTSGIRGKVKSKKRSSGARGERGR